MTASTSSSAEGQSRPSPETDTSRSPGLLVGGSDRCSNCGAGLAVDQRYCVECGTRRGQPRFALATGTVAEPAGTQTGQTAGGWSRLSATLAVIAVLLALGVGVLIGNSTQAPIKQPVKVQVTGGALSPATNSGSGSGAANTTSTGSPPSTSCAKGTAGCKNGKQTGNFFGG